MNLLQLVNFIALCHIIAISWEDYVFMSPHLWFIFLIKNRFMVFFGSKICLEKNKKFKAILLGQNMNYLK